MQQLHSIQMLILKQLLLSPLSRFTDLNIAGLTSDHFTYHLKKLTTLGLIEKQGKTYKLTTKGKEFANTMDTESMKIQKQAKISVMIIAKKNIDGKTHILIQKRLKEPYYGYHGFVTGKVIYGETIQEAAKRELKEETGLEADLEHRYTIQEHVYSKDSELLEDKFFHVVKASRVRGQLTNFEEGANAWIEECGFSQIEPKFYDEEDLLEWVNKGESGFLHRKYIVEEF